MTEAKGMNAGEICGTLWGKRLTDYLATDCEGSTLLNQKQQTFERIVIKPQEKGLLRSRGINQNIIVK
jgi:hypothetical protein